MQGKNNYLFYTEDMSSSNVDRLKLETELRRAIETDKPYRREHADFRLQLLSFFVPGQR